MTPLIPTPRSSYRTDRIATEWSDAAFAVALAIGGETPLDTDHEEVMVKRAEHNYVIQVNALIGSAGAVQVDSAAVTYPNTVTTTTTVPFIAR